MKTKVLKLLKTKVASLGFNEEELMDVTENIAGTLSEDASEEEIASKVDSVVPFLKLSQKSANRAISKAKKDFDDKLKQLEESKEKKDPEPPKKEDEMPAWFKAYQDSMEQRFEAIKTTETKKTRKEKVVEMLKEKGVFGQSKLRDFERMKFSDDNDFEAYVKSLQDDITTFDKEQKEKSLGSIKPFATSGDVKISEEDLDSIADSLI